MTRFLETSDGRRTINIQLPAGTLKLLGEMEPETWAQLHRDNKGHLRRWWNQGDVDALQRLLDWPVEFWEASGERPATSARSTKIFGGPTVARFVTKLAVASAGTLPLAPGARGVGIAVALTVAETGIEALTNSSSRSARIEVTSYLDDARFT
jgi:hypothetical protein